ncbi:hypothetical protein HYX13_04250, partial [Candidatus Woesearchaeota archaeon]|nr:hypothetical protein [Candidatus Woesearchaeota archaeon]
MVSNNSKTSSQDNSEGNSKTFQQESSERSNRTCFSYETYHEGENKILKISAEKCTFLPSIEYSEMCMSKVIDLLQTISGVTAIIISQLREYEYDYSQTKFLNELAVLCRRLNQEERYNYQKIILDPFHERYIRSSYAEFQKIISKKLKEDPLAAFVSLKRLHRREKVKHDTLLDPPHKEAQQNFVNVIEQVVQQVEALQIINLLMPHTKEYELGQRQIYEIAFHPTTKPDFMYTKLIQEFPDGELEESYTFGNAGDQCDVNIFTFDNS